MKWTFPDEDREVKSVRYTYKKRIFFIFFNRKRLVLVVFQPINNAAKSFDYIEQLYSVIGICGGKGSQIILHDNNAPTHTSKEAKKYFKREKLIRLTHP